MKIAALVTAAGIALSSLGLAGCTSSNATNGAIIGGATGLAIGAAATGNAGGAIVGTAIGAGVGAAIGAGLDPQVPPGCYRYDMYGRPYRVC